MKLIGHDEGMKLGFSARPAGGVRRRSAHPGRGALIGGIGVSGASEARMRNVRGRPGCHRRGMNQAALHTGRKNTR
jgi:hypothetical protein